MEVSKRKMQSGGGMKMQAYAEMLAQDARARMSIASSVQAINTLEYHQLLDRFLVPKNNKT